MKYPLIVLVFSLLFSACKPNPVTEYDPLLFEPPRSEIPVPGTTPAPLPAPTQSEQFGEYVPKWQIVYFGKYEPNGADYTILDLFEHSPADVKQAKFPIAYFSAHFENWRPDAKQFGPSIRKLGNWKGEWYVNWRDSKNQSVMKSRLDLAVKKGFKGVDIDNVDGPGGREYFPWLYAEAKKRGLAVGLKNFVEILPQYGSKVDFFVSEASALNELTCYSRYNKPVVRMYYGRGAKTPGFVYELRNGKNGNRF